MTFLEAILLGLLQGLTEFLPVSSSGHLVLGEQLLGLVRRDDVTFEVFVHFGTFLSVVVVFWNDIVAIVRSVWKAATTMNVSPKQFREDERFRLGVCIAVASIPAGVVGLLYEDEIAKAFADPKLAAVMLVITGLILFLTGLARPVENRKVGIVSALLIGMAQAFAIIPGISRSGSTISMAMYLRIAPVRAARFSFPIALPVIFGATLLKTKDLIVRGTTLEEFLPTLAATAVAFASGYVAINLLLKVMERGKLRWFSLYCLTVGILGILFI